MADLDHKWSQKLSQSISFYFFWSTCPLDPLGYACLHMNSSTQVVAFLHFAANSCLNTYIHSSAGAIEQCVIIAFDVIAATLSAYFCMYAIMLEGKCLMHTKVWNMHLACAVPVHFYGLVFEQLLHFAFSYHIWPFHSH